MKQRIKTTSRTLASVLILCVASSVNTFGQEPGKRPIAEQQTFSLQKRMFILSKTYSAISNYFVHWQDVPDLNLDDLYQKYLERAINTDSRYQFDLLMMEFINNLHNGHCWFRDKWLGREYGQPLDFNFRVLAGRWVVTGSTNPDIKAGDVLEKIDGQDFEAFYQAKKVYADQTNDRTSRVSFASPRFVFLLPKNFNLKLSSGKSVDVVRRAAAPNTPIVTGEWLEPNRIAYLRIVHFNDPAANDKAVAYVSQFKDAKALIIDVRGYSGGNTPEKLVDVLMDRPYRWFTESTNLNVGLFQFYGQLYERLRGQFPEQDIAFMKTMSDVFEHPSLVWPAKYQLPKETVYKNRLILLTDNGCISAKEDFLLPFKDNKRGTLVGEQTAGSSGQPFMYNFDADLNLAVGTKRLYMPDGSGFEKVGIAPDVEVSPTIEDIKSGRDPVLEKAISIARTSGS